MKHHFLLRIGLLFVLTMPLMSSNAFTLTGRYTTVVEDRYPLHYIKFEKAERGILQVMRYNFSEKGKDEYAFTFSILNDTITIVPTNWIDTTYNATFKRLAAAKFVIRENNLFDVQSGYTYVPEAAAKKYIPYITYIIDGEIYQEKNAKMRGGLIIEDYKTSGKLKRKFKDIRPQQYQTNIYVGKEAYNKFGLLAMNVVIEYKRKN